MGGMRGFGQSTVGLVGDVFVAIGALAIGAILALMALSAIPVGTPTVQEPTRAPIVIVPTTLPDIQLPTI